MRFEWDHKKGKSNRRKHGVDFDEAATVFADPLAAVFDDEIHSEDERREIIIGFSATGRLLVVAFTDRGEDLVRVYSARPATRTELMEHEEHWRTR